MGSRFFLMLVVIFFLEGNALAEQTILYYNSDPGDWIGQGQEQYYTTDEIDFTVQSNYGSYDRGVYIRMNNFDRNSFPNYISWSAHFTAPYRQPLTVGSYENATRFPFQSYDEPGLSFSGQGRGCNTLTGRFEIREIIYDPYSGEVINFAADFEQHCEGGEPALYGSIRYNSDIPIMTLLPPQIIVENGLNSDSCVEAINPAGATVILSGMSQQESESLIYNWSTSNGLVGSGINFSFDLGVNESAIVQLTLEDLSTGQQSTDTATVCVSDTTVPQINILSPSEGDVFIGNNIKLDLVINDLVDQNITNCEVFIGKSLILPVDSASGELNTNLFKTETNAPIQSEITVKAIDYSGNIGTETVNVILDHDMRE